MHRIYCSSFLSIRSGNCDKELQEYNRNNNSKIYSYYNYTYLILRIA